MKLGVMVKFHCSILGERQKISDWKLKDFASWLCDKDSSIRSFSGMPPFFDCVTRALNEDASITRFRQTVHSLELSEFLVDSAPHTTDNSEGKRRIFDLHK